MQVISYGEPVGGFEEFCEAHGIKLVARERSKHYNLPRWYVSGEPMVEIRERGILTCTFGDGNTPEEAKEDYARRLAGHRLLIDGYGGHEIVAPNEWAA